MKKNGLVATGIAIGVLALIGGPRDPARAAMAVIDSSNLAKNAETAATTAKQLVEIKSLLEVATNLYKGVGAAGGPGASLFALGSGDATSALGTSFGMTGWQPSVASWGLPKNLGQPNFGSAQAAVEFIRRVLEKVNTTGAFSDRAMIEQRRERAAYDAAFDNYGLALYNRNAAADASSRVNDLAAQAARATELRQDLQANTKVAIAQLEETMAIRALLAGLLEDRTADRIASYRTTFTDRPAPEVGNPFVPFGPPPGETEEAGGSALESVIK